MTAFVDAIGHVVLPNVPPAVRLAPERRDTRPFAWAGAATKSQDVAPAIVRSDFLMSTLEARGALPAAGCAKLRAVAGYKDLGWTMYTRSDRLGPVSPSLPARAGEIIILCHGWLATREIWQTLAIALARDNADALVLVPDVSGFGDSQWDQPTREQLSPFGLSRLLKAWLELVGLRSHPGVLVGHSASGMGILAPDAHDIGDKLVRLTLNPALPEHAPAARRGWWLAAKTFELTARWRWLHRFVAWLFERPGKVVPGASIEQRREHRAQFERTPPLFQAGLLRALVKVKLPPDALAGVEVVYGAHDPLLPRDCAERAIGLLGGSRDRAHLLASGGHVPQLWTPGDPEGAQRNLNELVAIISHVLLSAVDAVATSTLALSRTV
jgi:pimeloyl-ACP methyl ester carboxylesterase